MTSRARTAVLALTVLLAAASARAQIDARLLQQPDVSATRIAFVYGGDVWVVAKEGGLAQRLSTPRGEESFPRFSPDGSLIAFTGNYDGGIVQYDMPDVAHLLDTTLAGPGPAALAYAARVGAPILLTRRSTLTTGAVEMIAESASTEAVVVGGPNVVSEQVVEALRSDMTVQWLYGPDRYATNVLLVKQFWPTGDLQPYVATGTDFPDALVAGALAGRTGQPIVLSGSRVLPGVTREWVMHETARIPSFTMMGGPDAVSYLLEWQLAKARRVPAP